MNAYQELEARVSALQRELVHDRGIADPERKRAEIAEANAWPAWRLAGWGGTPQREQSRIHVE